MRKEAEFASQFIIRGQENWQ